MNKEKNKVDKNIIREIQNYFKGTTIEENDIVVVVNKKGKVVKNKYLIKKVTKDNEVIKIQVKREQKDNKISFIDFQLYDNDNVKFFGPRNYECKNGEKFSVSQWNVFIEFEKLGIKYSYTKDNHYTKKTKIGKNSEELFFIREWHDDDSIEFNVYDEETLYSMTIKTEDDYNIIKFYVDHQREAGYNKKTIVEKVKNIMNFPEWFDTNELSTSTILNDKKKEQILNFIDEKFKENIYEKEEYSYHNQEEYKKTLEINRIKEETERIKTDCGINPRKSLFMQLKESPVKTEFFNYLDSLKDTRYVIDYCKIRDFYCKNYNSEENMKNALKETEGYFNNVERNILKFLNNNKDTLKITLESNNQNQSNKI